MSKIEWCDKTLNPFVGCGGCELGSGPDGHCYAWRFARRMAANPKLPSEARDAYAAAAGPEGWTGKKEPTTFFVGSMGDVAVLYQSYFDELLVRISGGQHTYLLLTKNPDMLKTRISRSLSGIGSKSLANSIYVGVSVTDQSTADERVPHLIDIPAAGRFLSIEPMLGPVVVSKYLDGVIVGGETGPGARPMDPHWVRSIRDQCAAAEVPCFFKHWGEWVSASLPECPTGPGDWVWADGTQWEWVTGDENRGLPLFRRVGKKSAGRVLDGRTHDDLPWAVR